MRTLYCRWIQICSRQLNYEAGFLLLQLVETVFALGFIFNFLAR